MKDLIVLTADKDAEFAIREVLKRHEALGIRALTYDVYPHEHHDPGCRLRSPEFLHIFLNSHRYALVIFDREGCGRDDVTRQQIEEELEHNLAGAGWKDRASAIVIDPELEAWVWSDSPHVEKVLGWSGRDPALRTTLTAERFLSSIESKPARPKEAMRWALRAARKPPSSALFAELASTVSLSRCTDASFNKLLAVLRRWFARMPQH